jgi:glutathione S-transferase
MSSKKLFSFKRCPYAIRARMVLKLCKLDYELVEVDLKNKPQELIRISQKATVPVLVLEDEKIIDESIEIIRYALANNPESPLNIYDKNDKKIAELLIAENDSYFKFYLDKYKYYTRFPENNQLFYRQKAEVFLTKLDNMFDSKNSNFLLGKEIKYLDISIFPFVRQFCYVNEHWFREVSTYKNLILWLKNLENKRNIIDKIPAFR